jgi:hypothetical protein
MSKHTITAHMEVNFPGTDPTETETANITVEITYTATGGAPEHGPTYDCGGQPAEPVEIELVSAKLIDGDGIGLTSEQLTDRAESWLENDGYDAAVQAANEPYDDDTYPETN